MTHDESMKTAAPRAIVLVVDDEAPLRAVHRRFLQDAGYRVLEASDGEEGIAKAIGDDAIDLLIADLQMPVLGGEEMVRRIRLTRPRLPVLYVTGKIDALMDKRPLDDLEAFLEKPFTPSGLQQAVSLLLFGTTGARPGAAAPGKK